MLLFFFVSIPLTPRSTRTDTLLPYTALSRAHIVAVGEAEMLLGRDVTEHRGAVPADHRGADAAGDMVVTRRDVGGQRPERVEGRLAARFELLVHILLYLVHRDVARPLDRKSVV